MLATTRQKLERRFRIVLAFFMLALVLSGVTAFPLLSEFRLLAETLGVSPEVRQQHSEGLRYWIGYVHEGLEESYEKYPFLAFGFISSRRCVTMVLVRRRLGRLGARTL